VNVLNGGTAMHKSKTYFEQIPLKIVSKIAKADVPKTVKRIKAPKKGKVRNGRHGKQ
jgi:hypothetical protein